jgi:hypothetical protein
MSLFEPGRSHHGETRAGSAPRILRLVAIGCGAVFLLSSAYQASFATGRQGALASRPVYARDRDSGGGIGGGAIAGIAVGAGAAVLGIPALLAAKDDECEERLKMLPQDHTRISEIRLIPRQTTLDAGECRCFFLEVRSAHDNKWYSVTQRPEGEIRTAEVTEYLVRQDASKNVFCVPLTARPEGSGRSVLVVGTFTPPGQPTLTAESRVLLRAPR